MAERETVEVVMSDEVDAIVRDPRTGMFGFRLEMGRGRDGSRVQARRSGFATFQAALAEYRRLCAQRDAGQPKTRMTGNVRALCDGWLQAREQELEPNTLHNYGWLLGLIYPHGPVAGIAAELAGSRTDVSDPGSRGLLADDPAHPGPGVVEGVLRGDRAQPGHA
jgi:hypothetical protein